jgi:hypothetical protein
MNIPEKLLINLKIISKIPKNGRITKSSDGIIYLESNYFFKSIKRFLTSDSRKQSISELSSIYNEAILLIYNILAMVDIDPEKNLELLNLMLISIKESQFGLHNLKFTYKSDFNISSQLDIILIKIHSLLKDAFNKIEIFEKKYGRTIDTYSNAEERIHVIDMM